jgi:hypothetical protein
MPRRWVGLLLACSTLCAEARADEACLDRAAAARRDTLVPERPAFGSEAALGVYTLPRIGDAAAMRVAMEVATLHPLWFEGSARYVSLSEPHAFGGEGLAGVTLRHVRATACDRDRFDLRLLGGVRALSFSASHEEPRGMSAAVFGFGFAAATTDLGELDGRATILYDPTHSEVGYMMTGGWSPPLGGKWLRLGFEQGLVPAIGYGGGADIGVRFEL